MRRTLITSFVLITSLTSIFSVYSYASPANPLGDILSKAEQQEISPQDAIQRLREGNQRFLKNKPIPRDYLKQAHQSSYGQHPFAVVLSCMDSRSVPEFFFDQGLADLFTLRIAGTVLNDDILGSMEFATKAAGSRLIVVLGHTSCGAVAGACKGVRLGHLNDVLDKLQPAVKQTMRDQNISDCSDPKLVDAIASANALQVVEDIKAKSKIIRELIKDKKIKIVAGLHDIKTGEVHFFDENCVSDNK